MDSPSTIIEFNKNDMTFLGLNILGHDVLHDFGDASDRWSGCTKSIDFFINNPDVIMSGGGISTVSSYTPRQSRIQSQKKSSIPININAQFISKKYGISIDIAKQIIQYSIRTRQNPLTVVSEYINQPSFTIFNETIEEIAPIIQAEDDIDLYIDQTQTFALLNCLSLFIQIEPQYRNFQVLSNDIKSQQYLLQLCLNIFNAGDLSNDFFNLMGYNFYLFILASSIDYNSSLTINFDTIQNYLNIYFSKNYFFYNLLDIWFPTFESFDISKLNSYGLISGGAIEEAELQQAKYIQNVFNTFKQDPGINELIEEQQKIYDDWIFGNNTDENFTTYNTNKLNLITSLVNLCSNQDIKEYNKRYFDCAFVKIMPTLRGRLKPVNMKNEFDNFITNELLKKVSSIINKAEDDERKRLNYELSQKQKELAGELTDKHKAVIDDFSSFIARSALYVNNICDINGTYNYGEIIDGMLQRQIQILYTQARRSSPWGGDYLGSGADLDTILLNAAQNKGQNFLGNYSSNEIPLCNKGNYKCRSYIINNAAPLSKQYEQFSNYVFCPITSIVDAQPNCTYNTAMIEAGYEAGNMNFTLIDNSNPNYFYNGSIIPNILAKEATIKIHFNNPLRFSYENQVISKLDKEQSMLKAVNVLSTMLKNLYDKNFTQLQIPDGLVFSYMYKQANYLEYLKDVYYILFKGTGDLFQEINAVSSKGSYISGKPSYGPDELANSIAQINNNSRTRLFLANDRPSAVRFGFMLIRGLTNINQEAYGGFLTSSGKIVIFKKNKNDVDCRGCSGNVRGGGKKLFKLNNKHNSSLKYKNLRKNKKYTTLKHHKKYSNSRKQIKSKTYKHKSIPRRRRNNKSYKKRYSVKVK